MFKKNAFEYIDMVTVAALAVAVFFLAVLVNQGHPDYQFSEVKILASEEPIDISNRGNNGQFSLWQGENYLLLVTHGGEDGYILDSWANGEEEAAVSYAIDTAVNGSSYRGDVLDRVVYDREINVNDIDVIYIDCCYPAAHQNGSIELPYLVDSGRLATSEDMLDDVFGDGSKVGYKEVPILIVGTENNVTYGNGFYSRGDENVRTVNVWTGIVTSRLVSIHNAMVSMVSL